MKTVSPNGILPFNSKFRNICRIQNILCLQFDSYSPNGRRICFYTTNLCLDCLDISPWREQTSTRP